MAQIVFFASALSVLGLPMLGLVTLLSAKLASGDAARKAQRRFLAVLLLVTIVTVHTVTTQNQAWLIHTVTLAVMIVGSLWSPTATPASSVPRASSASTGVHPLF